MTHFSFSMMKYYAIIVAGGSGTRMETSTPKQFLLLAGKPVLMHTISAFQSTIFSPEIIVVLHQNFHDYWKKLCTDNEFTIPHQLIAGGETRFHSVKKGIAMINDPSIVAIHDAVRPLIDIETIAKSYIGAEKNGSAVVAVKSKDSVRRVSGAQSVSLAREEIYLVQTPQVFQSALLKAAYMQQYSSSFTDDASVVEKFGAEIHLIAGNYNNLKVTFPDDLIIAEFLYTKKATKNSGL
ncbi:MAG: 2-C-methyl-D-erythritol 4-phosphate cytidylyltransferase [Sphingobacteriaceae bacterium]